MSKTVLSTIKVVFLFLAISLSVNAVKGQDDSNKNQSSVVKQTINKKERFDITLHLLIASDKQGDNEKLPSSLESVAKHLRSSLSLKNVSVLESFLYRTEERGSVEARGFTTTRISTSNPSPKVVSSHYEVSFVTSELIKDDVGRSQIKLDRLRFGMRYPLVTDSITTGGAPMPIINYEPIGLTLSSLSLTENEPTLVGTLSVGRDNETLAIVATVNRVISR